MPEAGRMRVGGFQRAFTTCGMMPMPYRCTDGARPAGALTVFPLIKVASKLPLCWKNYLDSGVRRQKRVDAR